MATRICHVTSLHPAFDVRIFHKECTSLAKLFDTTLIAPNVDDQERNGVHIKGVNLPASRLRRLLCLRRVYRKMEEVDAEIYHLHDPELIPLGIKIKKEKGKTIVFDSHEDVAVQIAEKEWLPRWVRMPLQSLYSRYERKALKKYSALVTVTPSIVERLTAINPNTRMVTNYPVYRERNDNREFGNSVCFAGGIAAQWMHEEILDAIAPLDVHYLLAGTVDSTSYLGRLKSKDAWRKVTFYGKVPHDKVFEIMDKSVAGMVLNDYMANVGYHAGSLGNTKLFETMMEGIPVVATNFTLWQDVIDRWQCGICVDPHDISAITQAISRLLKDPDLARQMGDNGRRAVKEKYNWASQETVLIDLYKSMVDNRL